ncbi:hypothetical protein [Jiella marina]|uniref:hypothetical protein n=1 Tax=Jiella sp. LLJ827 TaxID=2917712 RepID=UPI00210109C3|nr:hypothetical protein [Jiella sp. LLJ827]MCQ0989419.1 hypothetical protein [Jiella sp. LLJ827]
MLSSTLRVAGAALLCLAVAGCSSTASRSTSADSGLVHSTAYAPVEEATGQSRIDKPYFISFRARNALSYGHSFVVFGKLDANGRVPYDANGVLIPSMTEVAGLHPASTSNVPYTIGHVLPVPSETGPSDGDTERAYMTAEWTVPLTASQYQDVVAHIRDLQGSSPLWHAVAYNCSSFVGDIAKHMGYRVPNHMLFPQTYVEELKAMNT